MLFQQDNNNSAIIISSYQPGNLILNGHSYIDNVLISNEQVHLDKLPKQFNDLLPEHIDTLCQVRAEVILVGSGARSLQPSIQVRQAAIKQGAAIEFMDTQAACRTYTIVSAEGRSVVAALFVQ